MTDSIKEVPMKNVNLEEWTYEDYLTLPEGGPFRYEIIDGELCMTPSPNTKHQKISRNILHFIDSFLRQNTVGEIFYAPYDVVFSQDPLQVAEPDLVFVSKARAAIITEKNIQGAPDLLIEILSPTTAANDRRVKRTLYERFGVPEYWIVDPEAETVQVFRLSDGRYGTCLEFRKEDALDSPLLPGLSIPLSGVFPA
jgi:Uma2 family endonuclease